jgi:hypothetical protein
MMVPSPHLTLLSFDEHADAEIARYANHGAVAIALIFIFGIASLVLTGLADVHEVERCPSSQQCVQDLGLVNKTNNPRITEPATQIATMMPPPSTVPTARPASSALPVTLTSEAALIPLISHQSIRTFQRTKPHLNTLPKKPRFGTRIANPHLGHLLALELTSVLHSGHAINAIATSSHIYDLTTCNAPIYGARSKLPHGRLVLRRNSIRA